MTNTQLESAWNKYTTGEIEVLKPILEQHHITLHTEQPHISGERFLMSGKKVVLVGTDTATSQTVIIKSSDDPHMIKELQQERAASSGLENIHFAYQPLLQPRELWCEENPDRLTVAIESIDQPEPFLGLPLKKQFDLILGAFTMLESVHATTNSHARAVTQFGNKRSSNYLDAAKNFCNVIVTHADSYASAAVSQGLQILQNESETIEQYCGFLTHDDFALHNFRFKNDAIYIIDQSSLTFGNKHESWARLMNYMMLYNFELEQAFAKYVADNLPPEAQSSYRLMRIYKLIELLHYHTTAAEHAVDNVQALSHARVQFWTTVLKAIIQNEALDQTAIDTYKQTRDSLRSSAEIERQKALQQLL